MDYARIVYMHDDGPPTDTKRKHRLLSNVVRLPMSPAWIAVLSHKARGVHPLRGNMHFPSVSEKISDSVENLPNCTISRKKFRFSSAKISDDLLLVINHKWRIPPFSLFQYISPLFRQNYSFLSTFQNFSLFSVNLRVFYMLYVFFVSTYFYHDAFMHHTMHVGLGPTGRPCTRLKGLMRNKKVKRVWTKRDKILSQSAFTQCHASEQIVCN